MMKFRGVAVIGFVVGACMGACGDTKPTPGADAKQVALVQAEADTPSKTQAEALAKGDADPPGSTPVDATPNVAKPPAAPPGIYAYDDGRFVQRCDDALPCPSLTQPEGVKHCASLDVGGRKNWRLPTKREVEGFRRIEELAQRQGYHFTSTVDDGNTSLVWIVDPTGTQPTTIPPTRKPFTIRCVSDPS